MANRDESMDGLLKRELVPIVREAFGNALRSVLLYGSGAGGHFVRGVSDLNVLVIVEYLDAAALERFGRRGARVLRRRRVVPLVMTRQEFVSSADVFPMEYLDIRQRHLVLTGEDETATLDLTGANLRHQIEDGLRGTLAVLRQAVLASRGRKRVMRLFLKAWLGRQAAVLRGLLRLKTEGDVPLDLGEVITAMGREYGIETQSFEKLLQLREGGKGDPIEISHAVQASLAELVGIVDAMDGPA